MSADEHLSPQQFYHVASPQNRESISRSGLDPLHGSTPEEREDGIGPGVWMFNNHQAAVRGIDQRRNDVWEVHPQAHNIEPGHTASAEWGPDDPVSVTYDHIRPEHLRLWHAGGA